MEEGKTSGALKVAFYTNGSKEGTAGGREGEREESAGTLPPSLSSASSITPCLSAVAPLSRYATPRASVNGKLISPTTGVNHDAVWIWGWAAAARQNGFLGSSRKSRKSEESAKDQSRHGAPGAK